MVSVNGLEERPHYTLSSEAVKPLKSQGLAPFPLCFLMFWLK